MVHDTASSPSILRALPSVDALLRTEESRSLREMVGAERLTIIARAITNEMRREMKDRHSVGEIDEADSSRALLLADALHRLELECRKEVESGLRHVINATGVILHTNLGRAPLSEAARRAVAEEAAGYCTLEYDLETGRRGRRGAHVEELLTDLTGAEAALVVNNCAAAALLILSVLAKGGETLVSRGELVEIGGDFRVPDVMAQSGTRMVEVGTTNRTRISDYQRAITTVTRLIMRVHPSNYRIVGFTARPSLTELAHLAHSQGLTLYEDAGSGALFDLRAYGLPDEPVIKQSVENGVDIVSFSGDKLVGSVQAGLIVGRRAIVEGLRKSPLYRALRADKLALAALGSTLKAHRAGRSFREIPFMQMLASTTAELEERATAIISQLEREKGPLHLKVVKGFSAIGGGSAPTTELESPLIGLSHEFFSADEVAQTLRFAKTPVIVRISDEMVVLDLRTVAKDEEPSLVDALSRLSSGEVLATL